MRKGQAILEVAVIFIIGLFMFFGIMGIWIWGDRQIAQRQPEYNGPMFGNYLTSSRVRAGTVAPIDNKPLVWPVYEREELTEQEVFGGQDIVPQPTNVE